MRKRAGSKNESGTILIIALFLIAALSLLGLAANRNIAVDTAITSSQLSAAQSFYVAEAGLQMGQLEVIQRLSALSWTDFSPLLNNDSTVFSISLNQITSLGSGTYLVTACNNSSEANPKVDSDRTIIIKSEGRCGNSTSMLASTIRALTIPSMPGGITFVGDATMTVGPNPYQISGFDHKLSDQINSPTGSGSALPAVALCAAGNLTVSGTLAQGNLKGSASISNSTILTEVLLESYIDDLKPSASSAVNCGALNLIYQKGNMIVNCSAGEGVLITDGNLEFANGANWKGFIIVRGGTLKLSGNNEVRGGVIIAKNPAQPSNTQAVGVDLSGSGPVNLLRSNEAVQLMGNGAISANVGKWKILSWQRIR